MPLGDADCPIFEAEGAPQDTIKVETTAAITTPSVRLNLDPIMPRTCHRDPGVGKALAQYGKRGCPNQQ